MLLELETGGFESGGGKAVVVSVSIDTSVASGLLCAKILWLFAFWVEPREAKPPLFAKLAKPPPVGAAAPGAEPPIPESPPALTEENPDWPNAGVEVEAEPHGDDLAPRPAAWPKDGALG